MGLNGIDSCCHNRIRHKAGDRAQVLVSRYVEVAMHSPILAPAAKSKRRKGKEE